MGCDAVVPSLTREEEHQSRIASGNLADITALDGDCWNCPAEAIKDLRVDLTIIDGRVAYERGK